jgi:hypothetical protein
MHMEIKQKISALGIPQAIIISAFIISFSLFCTVLIFFGGTNNRTKLFSESLTKPPVNAFNPTQNRTSPISIPTNTAKILPRATTNTGSVK